MHLLVVTTTSDRSETALYAGLVARGHRVSMLCAQSAPERPALAAAGVALHDIRIRHRLDLAAVGTIRGAVNTLNPDVVYAPRNGSLSVSLLATRGTSSAVVAYRGTSGHISRFDPAAWLTYLHPRTRRIVCVSEAVRNYLLGCGLPAARLVTIYKGHEVAWYDAMTAPSRRDLGLPDDAFLLGFTGRVRPVKGGDILLKALMAVPRELNVHLVIIGKIDDARVSRLAAHPAIRDRVHALGFRRDAAAIAARFDAFAMPSVEREGLPRAVIEAMSQRVAPIVSDVGGMPELVVDGDCGRVVPPRDVQALASAITQLAGDRGRCRQLGQAARLRIETAFSLTTTLNRFELLLEKTLADPGPDQQQARA